MESIFAVVQLSQRQPFADYWAPVAQGKHVHLVKVVRGDGQVNIVNLLYQMGIPDAENYSIWTGDASDVSWHAKDPGGQDDVTVSFYLNVREAIKTLSELVQMAFTEERLEEIVDVMETIVVDRPSRFARISDAEKPDGTMILLPILEVLAEILERTWRVEDVSQGMLDVMGRVLDFLEIDTKPTGQEDSSGQVGGKLFSLAGLGCFKKNLFFLAQYAFEKAQYFIDRKHIDRAPSKRRDLMLYSARSRIYTGDYQTSLLICKNLGLPDNVQCNEDDAIALRIAAFAVAGAERDFPMAIEIMERALCFHRTGDFVDSLKDATHVDIQMELFVMQALSGVYIPSEKFERCLSDAQFFGHQNYIVYTSSFLEVVQCFQEKNFDEMDKKVDSIDRWVTNASLSPNLLQAITLNLQPLARILRAVLAINTNQLVQEAYADIDAMWDLFYSGFWSGVPWTFLLQNPHL